MRNKEIIEIIEREREGVRDEKKQIERSLYQGFLAIITAGAVAAGVFIKLDGDARGLALIAVSQVQFLLILFGITSLSSMNMMAGYMRFQEERINRLAGVRVCLWESQITKRYYSLRGSTGWTLLALNLFFTIIFIITGVSSALIKGSPDGAEFHISLYPGCSTDLLHTFNYCSLGWLFLGIIVLEIIVGVVLLIAANGELERAFNYAEKVE